MVRLKYTSEHNGEVRMIKVHDDVFQKIEAMQDGEANESIYQFNGMLGQDEYLRMIAVAGRKEYEVMESPKADGIDVFVNSTNTDGIEVEYLEMPITGLYYEFMFRYSAPVQMVWTTNSLKITHSLTMMNDGLDLTARLKKAFVERFIEMSEEQGLVGLKQSMPCKLVEMQLVRKVKEEGLGEEFLRAVDLKDFK